MGDKTAIEWTDATWNPVRGCARQAKQADPCARSRCRTVLVDGDELQVPRHISRVDCKRARGWQVRFEKPSIFCSDAAHRGDPRASLRAAKRELRRVWRPGEKETARAPARGVRVFRDARGRWYAEASHPRRGAARRFYIGTDATRTQRRERDARAEARQQRSAWLAAIEVPTR
jgi:hypothetical protein